MTAALLWPNAAVYSSDAAPAANKAVAVRPVPAYPANTGANKAPAHAAEVGILTDALRAKAFLGKIPAFDRQRLKDGYEQYEAWQAEAALAKLSERKRRQAEGIKLYDEIQSRYRTLFTSPHLSDRVRDDIAYNRALLAFRHSRLLPKLSAPLLTDGLSYLKGVSAQRSRTSADVLFLKARLWEALGRKQAAVSVYHRIAEVFAPRPSSGDHHPTDTAIAANPSPAALLATVYSGDDLFEQSDYDGSIVRYRAALALAKKLSAIPRDFTALVQYRLMWSLHRNVDENEAVAMAKELLKASQPLRSRADQDKLSQDSLDILAEGLLEDFKTGEFVEVVKGIGLKRYRLAFAQQISERLLAENRATDGLRVLTWLYHEDPLHRGLPVTMTQLALIYGAQQATAKARQTALDLLRIFEPGSLWRRSHGLTALTLNDQPPATKKLISTTLTDLYRTALADSQEAKAAAIYHRTWLTAFSLDRKEKITALERLARLQMLQGDLSGSKRYAQQLANLQRRRRSSASELDVVIALKQLEQLEQLKQGQQSKKSSNRRAAEQTLATSLAGYQDSRDYDPDSEVIGAIAAYYAEHGHSAKAKRLWRGQLEAAKDRYTRMAALRALLERSLTAQDYRQTEQLIERYYFDDERMARQQPFASSAELDRVYHKALLGQFKKLKADGKLASAAAHLQDKLTRYGTKIPRHRELLGLMYQSFGVTGQWAEIIAAYDDSFGKRSAMDSPADRSALPSAQIAATYALALERSMRYLDAANQYVAFAKRFPALARKKNSLTKALALADGEEDYHLAGDVAFRLAKGQKSRPMAQRYLRIAAKNYALAGYRKGVDAVLIAQNAKSSADQRARLYLTLAHNARRADDWPMAERYAKRAIKEVKKLPADEFTYQYRKMLAESYYLLAKQHIDHDRAKDGIPQLKGLKQRLYRDLATVKTLKHYSQQVSQYGDPEDKLKMYSLIAVTSQNLASQLADVRFRLSQQGDDDKLQAVKRVQNKLRTLAGHYFGRADITLAQAGPAALPPSQGSSRYGSTDRATATALSAPSSSMFRPDSYAEGGYDGTTWVH